MYIYIYYLYIYILLLLQINNIHTYYSYVRIIKDE
jgi:hypothetical protein